VFWNKQSALAWLQGAQFPLVFKLRAGAGSENVLLIHSLSHAERLVKKMFGTGARSGHLPLFGSLRWREMVKRERLRRLGGKVRRFLRGEEIAPFEQSHRDYVLFQRFLEGNEFDTRVYVNGDRAFGYRRHVRKNDFRASGSGVFDWNPDSLDKECIQISFDISRRLGFQSMAYDFLFDEKNRPCISEISYTLADWGISRCPGYWDLALKWHEGHYWPQYLTLRNILKLADLKQPEMSLPPGHIAMR
jgi:glutathione synthase/RimK-type ligase-like ATP-grasp enzyme